MRPQFKMRSHNFVGKFFCQCTKHYSHGGHIQSKQLFVDQLCAFTKPFGSWCKMCIVLRNSVMWIPIKLDFECKIMLSNGKRNHNLRHGHISKACKSQKWSNAWSQGSSICKTIWNLMRNLHREIFHTYAKFTDAFENGFRMRNFAKPQ